MSAALSTPPVVGRALHVVVRPAPRREPPFDDELPPSLHGPHDRALPLQLMPMRAVAWRPRPQQTNGLPDPARWGRRLLVGMIEAAAGQRPLHQLTALLSPSVARGLGAEFERAAQQGRPHWLHRARIGSVRACQPAERTAELCATVETGPRVRAIAMRLEEHRGRWWCTRLQLG